MKCRFLLFIFSAVFLQACHQNTFTEKSYSFQTMGTYGTVKYISDKDDAELISKAIDSILLFVNHSMSTYIDDSEISLYSKYFGTDDFSDFEKTLSVEFNDVLQASDEVYLQTQGAFNPLVKPLIDYWGFGPGKAAVEVDSAEVLRLMECVDYNRFLHLRNNYESDSSATCFQLDFSAIAKGFGVDLVAYYFDSLGIENYMVEIGGEVNCKGRNIKNEFWKIGIEKPNEEERELYFAVSVGNRSLATSGNYRNFKVLASGQKVVHIVNPATGFTVSSNLLSASIFAENCMLADAFATACMVMGVENCFDLVSRTDGLDCFLIFSDEEGNLQHMYTDAIEPYIVVLQ
jgi:FAD:protein FMN transferase